MMKKKVMVEDDGYTVYMSGMKGMKQIRSNMKISECQCSYNIS